MCDGVKGLDPDVFLSTHELPLKADMHEMFEQHRIQLEKETVECFHSLCNSERVDLLENRAPWDSPLSAAVERLGGSAMRVGLHNNFDMSTSGGLRKVLDLLRKVKPRYLHISPPCFPFSIMQNANQRDDDQKQRLHEKRQKGRRILKNCRTVLEVQIKELGAQGGFADDDGMHEGGFEQPLRATSWQEPDVKHMSKLRGGRFRVDGCQHGLVDERWKTLLLKSFGWLSTNSAIRKALGRTCNHGPHAHLPIEGSRTAPSAAYPRLLCERFAKALLSERTRFEEIKQHLMLIRDLPIFAGEVVGNGNPEAEGDNSGIGQGNRDSGQLGDDPSGSSGGKTNRDELLRMLRVVHSNLGHPSKEAMYRLLKQAGAPQRALDVAKEFDCEVCRQRGRRASTVPSAIPAVTQPWEVVSVDTFWRQSPHTNKQGKPVEFCAGASFLDECTNFHASVVVRVDKKQTPEVSRLKSLKMLLFGDG